MISSPNRFIADSAACMGREGTCVAAGTATLAGDWLASTKLGQAALVLFGFGTEVQSMVDSVSSAKDISGVEVKAEKGLV